MIRGFGTKPPFCHDCILAKGDHPPTSSEGQPYQAPSIGTFMTTVEPSKMVRTNILRCHARFVGALRKTLGFVLEMLSAYLSMSNFRFCCRTCWEILLDILLKKHRGHVSVHLNFVGVFPAKNSIGQNAWKPICWKFATTSISQRGSLNKSALIFSCQGPCVNEHRMKHTKLEGCSGWKNTYHPQTSLKNKALTTPY